MIKYSVVCCALLAVLVATPALCTPIIEQVELPVPIADYAPELPLFTVDLSKAPEERWTEIGTQYKDLISKVVNLFVNAVPESMRSKALEMLDTKFEKEAKNVGELAGEIQGLADATGLRFGEVFVLNVFYSITPVCTSIVSQTSNGTILHARNLDFGFGSFTEDLREMALNVRWVQDGKEVARATTYAGFVGILTAQRHGAFSLSIDERKPGAVWKLFGNAYEAHKTGGYRDSFVAFLARDVILKESTFDAAVDKLANTTLIAQVYFIVAGTQRGEGCIITRNRDGAADVWRLGQNAGKDYILETNYDHWKKVPFYDDRRGPATKVLDSFKSNDLTMEELYTTLSYKPVMNLQTTYTALMEPATGYFRGMKRTCSTDGDEPKGKHCKIW